jgi:hypothetical protein
VLQVPPLQHKDAHSLSEEHDEPTTSPGNFRHSNLAFERLSILILIASFCSHEKVVTPLGFANAVTDATSNKIPNKKDFINTPID